MKRIFLSIVLLVPLAGCFIGDPAAYLGAPIIFGMELHPQLNEEAEAAAGSVLFSEERSMSRQIAVLSTNGKTATLSRRATDGTETYCYGYLHIVCCSSSDGKNFDRRQYDTLHFSSYGTKRLSRQISFAKGKRVDSTEKYELVYDGIDNENIKFTYKKYSVDVNNPIYTQELRFPVSPFPETIDLGKVYPTADLGKVYGVASYVVALNLPKIEVLGVHDNVIRYKVLSGFSDISYQRRSQQLGQQPVQSQ